MDVHRCKRAMSPRKTINKGEHASQIDNLTTKIYIE